MIPSRENGFALASRMGTHATPIITNILVQEYYRSRHTDFKSPGKGHNTIEDYFSDIVIRGPHRHIP